MERKKRSLAPGIIGIVICVLLLMMAIVSVVIAVSDAGEGELPYFLGTGICSSNGIYEGVDKNAVVLAKKASENTLAAGDVIVFYHAEAQTASKLYLANVLEVKDDGMLSVYLGEQLGDMDISMDLVRGEAAYSVGGLGRIVSIMEGKYGILLSMALCLLLLAIIVLLTGNVIGQYHENKVYAALDEAKDMLESEEDAAEAEEAEEEFYEAPKQKASKAIPAVSVCPQEEKIEETVEEEILPEETDIEAEEEVLLSEEEQIIEEAFAGVEAEELQMAETETATETETEAETEETCPEEIAAAEEENQAETPAEEPAEELPQEEADFEEIAEDADPAEETLAEPVKAEIPQELQSSYLRGSFGADRVNMEIACTEKEAEVMKKIIDLSAKKRSRFGLFTSINYAEECILKVWCEWEDVASVAAIVCEVKKRSEQKG
ncbi:MAG: hypothetical protein IKM60_03075 [Clostridia bacterium]|nr:hypothetical protein [Clostridia bacterium]